MPINGPYPRRLQVPKMPGTSGSNRMAGAIPGAAAGLGSAPPPLPPAHSAGLPPRPGVMSNVPFQPGAMLPGPTSSPMPLPAPGAAPMLPGPPGYRTVPWHGSPESLTAAHQVTQPVFGGNGVNVGNGASNPLDVLGHDMTSAHIANSGSSNPGMIGKPQIGHRYMDVINRLDGVVTHPEDRRVLDQYRDYVRQTYGVGQGQGGGAVPGGPLPVPPAPAAVTPAPPLMQNPVAPPDMSKYDGRFGGPLAPHAQTPYGQWTPEMHQQFEQNTPGLQMGLGAIQARSAQANAVSQRNTRTYDSMGRPPGYTPPAVADEISGLVRGNQRQQMLNGLSASDAKQLRLGGARPEVEQTLPPPPKLDQGSRFAVPRGVNHNDQTGSVYFQNGSGTGILGKNAAEALRAKGLRPEDLDPRSPYNQQARDAVREIGQQAETRRAEERTAEGGGLSRAGQYAQEQSDRRTLNRARLQGVGAESPVVSEAMGRETARQETMRDQLAGLAPGSSGSYEKSLKSANEFAKSEFGKQLASFNGNPRQVSEHLARVWPKLSNQEKQQVQNWFESTPSLANSDSEHANDIRSLFRSKGKNPPAPRRPTPKGKLAQGLEDTFGTPKAPPNYQQVYPDSGYAMPSM